MASASTPRIRRISCGLEGPSETTSPLLHVLTFEHVHGAPLVDQQLVDITLRRRNHQTTLAFGLFTEADGTGDLRQNGRLFRLTRFKQVGNPWQTTGDVLVTGTFLRNTGDNIADLNFCYTSSTCSATPMQASGTAPDCRCSQKAVSSFPAWHRQKADHRTQIFTRRRTILRIEDFDVTQTGQLVGLTTDGDAVFHTGEGNFTADFSDDWMGVRIPVCNDVAGINAGTILNTQIPSRKAAYNARAHDRAHRSHPAHRNGKWQPRLPSLRSTNLRLCRRISPPFLT